MRSPAFHCWLCAFLASAASVVSAPPYDVLTEEEILREWIDWGDTWGMDECFPDSLPSSVCEILSCTGDGFSRFFPDIRPQNISGSITEHDGLCWLAAYPMVTGRGGNAIQSFPTFFDFMSYCTSPGAGILSTFNFNSLSWSVEDDEPFRYYWSSPVSNCISSVRFNWENCPVMVDYYVGVNYVPRWWADGNIIGCVPYSRYVEYFHCMNTHGEPVSVPAIYVRDTDLRNVFTNSIHFKFGELWE